MKTHISNVGVFLGEDTTISSHTWKSSGSESGVFSISARFGFEVTFYVDHADPEDLDRLAEVVADLAAWRRQQIAAEGGAES
ncbi:hypothetical protein [Streptomyces syringium]|uniref:hypothetical protein n=1 Tax=Streptomyces syringium TaxID=76729 RepID=UPI0037D3DF4D